MSSDSDTEKRRAPHLFISNSPFRILRICEKKRMAVRSVVVLLFLIHAAALATANRFTVGDEHGWNPNVNYTIWEQKHKPFYVGDWLVFYYQSGQADIIQVDEVGYNKCDASNPISNYSKGRSYAFELNETKHYYFICSYGYCYNGMKLAIKAQALPPPSPPPKGHKSDAFPLVGSRFVGSVAGFFGLVIFFWLF